MRTTNATSGKSARNVKGQDRKLFGSRNVGKRKKPEPEQRKSADSAKSNDRRRKKKERRRESAKKGDELSGSAYGRSNGRLTSKGKEKDRNGTSGGDEKNPSGIESAKEIGIEIETEIMIVIVTVTATVTVIMSVHGAMIVMKDPPATVTLPATVILLATGTGEENVPRHRRIRLLLHRSLSTTRPWRRLRCSCS